jgi:hypothetical protein
MLDSLHLNGYKIKNKKTKLQLPIQGNPYLRGGGGEIITCVVVKQL